MKKLLIVWTAFGYIVSSLDNTIQELLGITLKKSETSCLTGIYRFLTPEFGQNEHER
jgi:hypothetical protein